MIIKQLSVFLEDKAGRLTEITRLLAEKGINMSAFSIADATDYGIVRMIVSKPDEALKVLKENRFSANLTDVVCIVVPNEPGGLHKALKILSDNEITIDYMYAFELDKSASVVIRTASVKKVIEVLQKNKISLVKASDIYKI